MPVFVHGREILERWHGLTGRHGHPSDPEFAHYIAMTLDALVLDPAVIQDTLGVLLKYQDDIARMQGGEAARLLEEVRNAARAPA